MAYKSLVIVITQESGLGGPLTAAIDLARRWDAHLHVLCVGIDRVVTDVYFSGTGMAIRIDAMDEATKAAHQLQSLARTHLDAQDIRWSVDQAVVAEGMLYTVVAQGTRYADLVTLPKPYGPDGSDASVAVTEAALFGGRVPVLILGPGAKWPERNRRIVLAWNESPEALRATRASLPLLKQADLVDIIVVDPRPSGPERSDPGGALSEMLVRHGVKAQVTVVAKTLPRVSDLILRQARESGADLIVMGAYGHSRLRESILGGATRAMLEQADIPVFMAH
jgi:nucleotide-binding universal stress UspA family protein